MNLVDLVLIIFLLLGLIKGFRKGLLNSVIGLCSCLVGLFVAFKSYPYLVTWLEARFRLTAKFTQYFEKHIVLSETVSQLKLGALPLVDASTTVDGLSMSEKLRVQLFGFIQKMGEQTSQAPEACLGDVFYSFLAGIILKIIAIVLIWFLVNKGLMFLSRFLTTLTENTFIGTLNKVGGVCIGLLIRVLILSILIGLLSPFFSLVEHAEPSFLSAVLKTMGEARLVPYFLMVFSFLTGEMLSLWLLK